MTKKVLDMKQLYNDLANASGDDIGRKLRDLRKSGYYIPPEERDNFSKFAIKSSEERKQFIDSLSGEIKASVESTQVPAVPKAPEITPVQLSKEEPVKKPENHEQPVPPSIDAGKQDAGKQDAGKQGEADLLTQMGKLNDEIKKHRSANSRLGNELTGERKAREKLQHEFEEARKKLNELQQSQRKKPQMPKVPNPKDFDDGVADSKYYDAVDLYNQQVEKYQKDFDEYYHSEKPAYVNELETQISQLRPKVEEVTEYVSTSQQSQAEKRRDDSFRSMWETAGMFQEHLSMKTTKPLEDINKQVQIITNATAVDDSGNRLYSDIEVESAQRYWNGLPATDRKSFNTVAELIRPMYRFDGNVAVPDFARELDPKDPDDRRAILRIAMKRSGVHVQSLTEIPPAQSERDAALSKQQQNDNNAAKSMPTANLGENDDNFSGEQDRESKIKRFYEMGNMIRRNPMVIRNVNGNSHYNSAFAEEYKKLVSDLKIPVAA